MKVYTYKNCSSCRKATQWLSKNGIQFEELPIRETPPNKDELARMLQELDGEIKRLFNTSGTDYRTLGIKDKLAGMSSEEAFELLASNGNLIKRPFLLSDTWATTGFKEEIWNAHLK
jgi:arsenate reductase